MIIRGLHFSGFWRLGDWAAWSLNWHFAGMWFLVINGLAYLIYGLVSGRFRERLLPIRPIEVIQTIVETLHFKIAHEDISVYNAVQKLLYIVVILAGIAQVITGLAIWKPVQWSGLLAGRVPDRTRASFRGHDSDRRLSHRSCSSGIARAEDLVGHAGRRSTPEGTQACEGEPADMKSIFRPDRLQDASVLDDHRPLIRSLERRGLIRGGVSLGALVMLTGCDVTRPESVEAALLAISRFNDRIQAWLFDPNKLAPTYPASMILRPPKFNAYYDVMDVKPVSGATWRLELSGLVADKRPWTLHDLQSLPQASMVIKHICVEGWSYIGGWTGTPLRTFLERVGADLKARYVAFKTADNYPSSIDMATALHPQTLLATLYGEETLADPFGYPMRLRTATKLGYKNPKWVTAIEVTNTYPGGYWESRGFSWFAGI